MHWRTYARLIGQIEHWETQWLYALLATFDPELLASLGERPHSSRPTD